MKSNKQRRAKIKARRAERAAAVRALDPRVRPLSWPHGVVESNLAKLAHNGTYGLLPLFYVDTAFTCRDCGSAEVWTAKQQKWWYEEAKGHIHTVAVRCRLCRIKERLRVVEARRVAVEGLARRRLQQEQNNETS